MTTVTRPHAGAFTSLAASSEPSRRRPAGRPVRTESTPYPPWPSALSRPPAALDPRSTRLPGAGPAPASRPRDRYGPRSSPRCTVRSSASPCPPSPSAPSTASSPARGPKGCTRRGEGSWPAASCGWRGVSPSPSRAGWRPRTGRCSSEPSGSPGTWGPTPVSPSSAPGAPTEPSGSPCAVPSPAPSGSRWKSLWARISRTWARWRPADPGPNSPRASTAPACAGPAGTEGPSPSRRTRRRRTPWRRPEYCAGRPSCRPGARSPSSSGYVRARPAAPPPPRRPRAPDGPAATSSPRPTRRATTTARENCCGSPSRTCGPCSSVTGPTPRTFTSRPVSPGAADPSPPRRSGRPAWRCRSAPVSPSPHCGPWAVPNSPEPDPSPAASPDPSGTRVRTSRPAARASRPPSPSPWCSPRPAAGACRPRIWRSCFPRRSAASAGCAGRSTGAVSSRTRGPTDPGGPRPRRTRTARPCSVPTCSTPASGPGETRCAKRHAACGSASGGNSGSTTVRAAAPPSPVDRTAGPGPTWVAGPRICSTPDCWEAAAMRGASSTGRRRSRWRGCSAHPRWTPAGVCAAWERRSRATTPSATGPERCGRTRRRWPWPGWPPPATRRRRPPCCAGCSTRRRRSRTGCPRYAGEQRTAGARPVPHPAACRPAAVAAAGALHALLALAGIRPDAPGRSVSTHPLRSAPLGAIRFSGLVVAGEPFAVRVGRLGLGMVEQAAEGLQLGV